LEGHLYTMPPICGSGWLRRKITQGALFAGAPDVFEVANANNPPIQERGTDGRSECVVEALHRFAIFKARFSKFSSAIF